MQDLFVCLRKNVCQGDELEPHLQTMTEEVLTSTASSFELSVYAVIGNDATYNFLAQRANVKPRLSRATGTRKSDTTTSELL